MSTNAQTNKTNKIVAYIKDTKEHITAEQIETLKRMVRSYSLTYTDIDDEIRAMVANKKLKNKTVSLEKLAARAKAYYNFRSVDYFLCMLGYIPRVPAAKTNEDYEEAMRELKEQTEHMLLLYGQYAGYQHIYWAYAGGHKQWIEDGEPDFPDKEDYIREELGIIYF